MSPEPAILLVGGGKMGVALLQGWLSAGIAPAGIFVQEPSPSGELLAIATGSGINVAAKPDMPNPPAAVVLAIKPQIMTDALPLLRDVAGPNTVFLSIAAGYSVDRLGALLAEDTAIIRAMPNTPAAIGCGISVAFAGSGVTDAQARLCEDLLAAVGDVLWIDDEGKMDAVTALSGSGPAYVFLLTEAMAAAGVLAGLDTGLAKKLATATVAGAGELLRRSDIDASQLRANVTSPGGTTAAALKVLMAEENGMEKLLARAIAAAASRSRELASS
jgi:pyrroline-5-carboxylate reductase